MDNKHGELSVIYHETYKDDIQTILKNNKYWVFAWNIKKANDYTSSEIEKRFKIQKKGKDSKLLITCLKDDGDYVNLGLNPRAELRVHGYYFNYNIEYVIKFDMRLVQLGAGFEFFQLMHLGPNGADPLVQIETRNGKIGIRYNSLGKGLIIDSLYPEHTNKIEWIVCFKLHVNNGYIKIYNGEKLVWEIKGRTVLNETTGWTQYGVYKNGTGYNKNIDQSVEYYQYMICKK